MDPNIDTRLKSIEEKLEKTYDLVRRVRRVQKQGQMFRLFYWCLIILATLGAFYYIQPYLNQLLETYTGIQATQEKIQQYSIPDLKSLDGILDQLKGIQE